MARRSILEYFANFPRWGGQPSFVSRHGYRRETWPYLQLWHTANRFARDLEARHIDAGEKVLVWGPNSAEWAAVFWGTLLRGAVVVPMDDIAAPQFVRQVAAQVDARLAVCSRQHADHAGGRPVILLDQLSSALSARDGSAYPSPEVSRNDTAEIIFTSGTTAQPRGVVLSHGNLLANLEPLENEIARYLKYERWVHPLRFLELVPLSHVFGQFMGLLVPPLLGATVVFSDSLSPGDVLETIRRERVSVLAAVPRMLESVKGRVTHDLETQLNVEELGRKLEQAGRQTFLARWWTFRSLHHRLGWKFWAFVSGGAALDRETEDFFRRLGYAVVQGYGMTETASLISLNHPFHASYGSIGKALPGRDIKLDVNGEILVRGENVASGYWQDQGPAPVPGEEGWFRTGDLGELDDQGNLYFRGRKKDVIVTAEGMNIHPGDLEAALKRQPAVRDAVVVALARNGNAEPCAVLILEDGAQPEQVVDRANRELAGFQHMRCWYQWPQEDFPRTATRKPKTAEIQQAVAAGMGARPAAATARGGVKELIAQVTGRAPGGGRLDLSSIERVELMAALEDRYQTELDETRFSEAGTATEIERLMHELPLEAPALPFARWPLSAPVRWLRAVAWYALVWPAILIMAAPRISGRQNLQGLRGPALVICNHVQDYDSAYVMTALPARLRRRLAIAMQGERLRAMRNPPAQRPPLWRWWDRLAYFLLLALFNVFPLPKQSGFRKSFRFAGEVVDGGYSVLIFPEGELTQDGRVQPFRNGIGILARDLALPVVPLKIEGLYELRIRHQKFALPGFVRVTLGEPLRYGREYDPEAITRDLEQRVAAL